MAKLGKGQNVTTDDLLHICVALNSQIGNIMEIVLDENVLTAASWGIVRQTCALAPLRAIRAIMEYNYYLEQKYLNEGRVEARILTAAQAEALGYEDDYRRGAADHKLYADGFNSVEAIHHNIASLFLIEYNPQGGETYISSHLGILVVMLRRMAAGTIWAP